MSRPSDRELRDAIGPLDRMPVNMRRFFDLDQFDPMPTPGPQDWLANHPEPGQSFAEFVRSHMFGIAHCIYFRCLMNGSNHMAESDERPLHLCPVDLHKLYDSIGFDLTPRYAHLRDFCRDAGFNDEAHWIDMQLKRAELR